MTTELRERRHEQHGLADAVFLGGYLCRFAGRFLEPDGPLLGILRRRKVPHGLTTRAGSEQRPHRIRVHVARQPVLAARQCLRSAIQSIRQPHTKIAEIGDGGHGQPYTVETTPNLPHAASPAYDRKDALTRIYDPSNADDGGAPV